MVYQIKGIVKKLNGEFRSKNNIARKTYEEIEVFLVSSKVNMDLQIFK